MARIVWGLMGDSRGHLTRALIMARELSGHELLFVGGGCVEQLRQQGRRVYSLPLPGTVLADNRVQPLATAEQFLRLALCRGGVLRGLARELERFGPALAVTDYEYFLPRAARMLGIPCVSFGHQHVLTRCHDVLPPGQPVSRLATTAAIRLFFSVPERYLVTSFYSARPKGPETTVLPPVLRQDVIKLALRAGEHVLAYMRAGMPRAILEALAATGRAVRVYGLGDKPAAGNVRFCTADRQRFLEDLAGCAYVVSNGGHNLVSEALSLGKPVLATPMNMFYEQYANAWHLQRLGYGEYFMAEGGAARAVASFETRLDKLRQALSVPLDCGNLAAAQAISELVE